MERYRWQGECRTQRERALRSSSTSNRRWVSSANGTRTKQGFPTAAKASDWSRQVNEPRVSRHSDGRVRNGCGQEDPGRSSRRTESDAADLNSEYSRK